MYEMQKASGEDAICIPSGRFLPQHRFNWDEIPWAFIGGLSYTWEMKVIVVFVFVFVFFVFFVVFIATIGRDYGARSPAR